MNKVLNDKKASLILVIVCFLVYTILGFARNAYTAAIAGIVNDGVFTKMDAGTINSSFYITYTLSQVLGVYYADKISPFKTLTIGLLGTIASNIAMASSASFAVIFIARAFSGIVQFGIWPALLKIVSEYINVEYRRKAMYIMPLGLQAGNVSSYLIASFALTHGSWQNLFTISYVLISIISIIYFITIYFVRQKEEIKNKEVEDFKNPIPENKNTEPIPFLKLMLTSGAILMCIAALVKSMITSGISSWMPTMIMESYNVSPEFSSVLTTISICSNFLSVFFVILLYPRVFKNKVFSVGMFFLMSLPMVVLLVFIGKIPLALVVVLITFVNLFTNAIHQFFTVEIPSSYKKHNKIGMMAGIFNTFACIGIIISSSVYGYVADKFGWSVTIGLWVILVVVGLMVSFAAVPIWNRFVQAPKQKELQKELVNRSG